MIAGRARATAACLGLAILAAGCGGAPSTGNDAADVAAKIKGGLEAQAGAVQSVSTQAASAASAAAKAATQAPGALSTAAAAATQVPGGLATVATAATQAAPAVGTAQAAAGAAGAAVKGATGMTPQQIGQAARAEAARALNVPVDQVTLDRVDQVDWRDSSLGCGEPGKVYAQVIVEGYRAVLTVGGQRREVHADSGGRVVYCPNPTQ
jgi:hypothetical protein